MDIKVCRALREERREKREERRDMNYEI